MSELVVHQIHACPFSQRLEILLALKGQGAAVRFEVADVTRPRPDWLLQKTGGSTSLPILEIGGEGGLVLKESLVILQYLDDALPGPKIAQRDPARRAVENMLTRLEGEFGNQGYATFMNREPARRPALHEAMRAQYARLEAFLVRHAAGPTFLFEEFGWAEAVFTPLFMRLWFLDHYEGFELPPTPGFARVQRWRDASLAHPAAQQVSYEEIVKLYYDYGQGASNGKLPVGRAVSSFAASPPWRERPWPPRDKYGHAATDVELGLLPA